MFTWTMSLTALLGRRIDGERVVLLLVLLFARHDLLLKVGYLEDVGLVGLTESLLVAVADEPDASCPRRGDDGGVRACGH